MKIQNFWGFVRGLPLIAVLVLLLPLPVQATDSPFEDIGSKQDKSLSAEQIERFLFGTESADPVPQKSTAIKKDQPVRSEPRYEQSIDREREPLSMQPVDNPFEDIDSKQDKPLTVEELERFLFGTESADPAPRRSIVPKRSRSGRSKSGLYDRMEDRGRRDDKPLSTEETDRFLFGTEPADPESTATTGLYGRLEDGERRDDKPLSTEETDRFLLGIEPSDPESTATTGLYDRMEDGERRDDKPITIEEVDRFLLGIEPSDPESTATKKYRPVRSKPGFYERLKNSVRELFTGK